LTCTAVTEFVGVSPVTVVTVPGAVTVFAGCVTVAVSVAVAVLLGWVAVVAADVRVLVVPAVDAAARACSATVPEPPEPQELTTAALSVPAANTTNSVSVCLSRAMSEAPAPTVGAGPVTRIIWNG
jgi:hypothetical protein